MNFLGISPLQYGMLALGMMAIYYIMQQSQIAETVQTFSAFIDIASRCIDNQAAYFADMHAKGMRFTLITPNGVVVLDGAVNDVQNLDNHLDRPEIQSALKTGEGMIIRKSVTLNRDELYVARQINTGQGTMILRLSAEPTVIQHNRTAMLIMAITAITSITMLKLA